MVTVETPLDLFVKIMHGYKDSSRDYFDLEW
jgi:hypothetical protein